MVDAPRGSRGSATAQAVVQALYRRGARSVTDIGAETGVSRVTVSKVLDRLDEAGLVEGLAHRRQTDGRPASLHQIRADLGYVVGIDVGPGSLRVRVDNVEGPPRPVSGPAHDTPAASPLPAVASISADQLGLTMDATTPVVRRLQVLDSVLDAAIDQAGIPPDAIWSACAATPGIVDPSGVVTASSVIGQGWQGSALKRHLTARFGQSCAVAVENDGNCAAVAEADLGAGADVPGELVGVHAGHRLGIGVVRDGRLHRGSRGRVGEVANLKQSSWRAVNDWLTDRSRTQVVGLFGPPDQPWSEASETLVSEFSELLAQPLAELAFTFDPEVVVVGGGAAVAGAALLHRLNARLFELWEGLEPVDVRISPLRGDGVVLGATVCARQAAEKALLQRATEATR